MRIGYYPGCSLLGTAREFDNSIRLIMPRLDVELVEIPDWSCCGSTSAHAVNHKLALALPARVMALAEREKMDTVFAPCAECYNRLATVQVQARADESLRKELAATIEMEYNATVKVISLPEFMVQIGADAIKAAVSKPLANLKVASYYGCLLLRPPKIARFDDCESPVSMDNVVKALGATPVEWYYKTECCGAGFTLSKAEVIHSLVGKILKNAKANGADLIMVSCPMCHSNLDMRQVDIMKKTGEDLNIPVLYMSELMGLAFGISPEKLELKNHFISASKILAK